MNNKLYKLFRSANSRTFIVFKIESSKVQVEDPTVGLE